MRIHQLPPLIANQIAAGEVIERPASVVKELLENSLDAGANAITVEIGYGGLNQIKISDNGTGIWAEDLPLAISAHATSKITTLNDLYAIDSMGFRGEALASIASIAKVTISSKPSEQETAMMLRIQGTETTTSPCARTTGTTIDVVDLFFNAPVRKRFLKGEKLEFQAIESVIKRFALSAPTIALTLKHNGKQVLSLPAALSDAAQVTRMTRLMGNPFMSDAIYLDVERGGMRLYGWISGPAFQRSQNDRQWVYINQRMVKDKLINHALKQAYEAVLYPGRFPACVLYLTINHAEVDVNVHPTKHEVRFQQPRLVHDFLTSQITNALQAGEAPQEEPNYEYELHSQQPLAHALCEPFPQLAALNSEVQQGRTDNKLPWIVLNKHYILTFIEEQPYLVDLPALQKYTLTELTLPLASRPLLVPIRYPVSEVLKKCGAELTQLGIHLEYVGDSEVLVRSIPVQLPHLDLRLFFDTVAQLDVITIETLRELLNQTQVFDPQLLSLEEKLELHQLFIKFQGYEQKKTGVFHALTVEHCRNIVHV